MGSSLTAETVFVGAFIAILLCLFAYRARTTSSADHHGREGGEDPQASASKGTNYMRVVEDIVMSPSCLFGSTLVAALLAASYRRFLPPSPASAASSLMQREASFSEPSSSLATASALETGSAVSLLTPILEGGQETSTSSIILHHPSESLFTTVDNF